MDVGIIGGTGREGRGLALRLALAGHSVAIGSRDAVRAAATARDLRAQRSEDLGVGGFDNREAVERSELVFLSVPYAAHAATLEGLRDHLRDRIVVDLVVPLAPPRVTEVCLPPGGAAALEAREILHPSTAIVSALHHVSAAALEDAAAAVDCDVLVCADDAQARDTTLGLLREIGLRALDAGGLRNAVALEALTPVLLHLNRTYDATCGIRITGLTKAKPTTKGTETHEE